MTLDQDWLLLNDDGLVKVRDETLFGLHCCRSSVVSRFVFHVYICPLYWPPASYAYGITKRIGSWYHPREGLGEWVDLGSPELAEHAAQVLAPIINTRIAPYLAQFPDGKAVLRYASSWRHPFDPLFGFVQSGSSCGTDLFAYMWAWSGDRRRARASLKAAIADIRGDIARIQRERAKLRSKRPPTVRQMAQDREWLEGREEAIAHLQQTLSLVDRPEERRAFLQETANRNRAELKLDRARPVLEVLRRRRQRQRREQENILGRST